MLMGRKLLERLWVAVAALAALPCSADPGVLPQALVLGASLPLSGPLATLGAELQRGMQLGFAQINAAGGVGGRVVQMLVRDDAGAPERAAENTRALIAEGVLAMTGFVGSAAIEASLALTEEAGVPVVGVASSA